MPKNRVIFMGTPKIAAVCLAAILNLSNVEVIAVVCQPDRPTGRKQILTSCEVKTLAQKHNIKVLQADKVGELFEQIKDLNPDLIFTCAFGQFVPSSILNLPKYKCVNLHASLLPKLRGGAPIQWAIINQEKQTGFSLMYMNPKMDAGNIIKQYQIDIASNETYTSLYDKLCNLAKDVISKDFNMLFDENLSSYPQEENKVTFGLNIQREDEKIDWNKKNDQVDALIRGLYDKPIAFTTYEDQIVKIYKAIKVESFANAIPGSIVSIDNDGIVVQTSFNAIKILELQLSGKKPCSVKQMLNGNHPFKVGHRFK